MSHRRRALRPPRTRPLGPRDPVEPDCPPAHPLHTAGDARHAGAVRGRPRGAPPGARHGHCRASARPPGDRARDRARVGARGRGLPAGEPGPLIREFGSETAQESSIGDHVRHLRAQALAQAGDFDGARAMAASVAESYRESRLAPRALLLAATFAARAGDDAQAQTLLGRLVDKYPDAPELPETLYLLGMSAEARGQRELAARTYRDLRVMVPASDYADGAADRLAELGAAGVGVAPLTIGERIDRAERLLRGDAPEIAIIAIDEAERIVAEAPEPAIVLRALRVVADGARKLNRNESAARALEQALTLAPAAERPTLH